MWRYVDASERGLSNFRKLPEPGRGLEPYEARYEYLEWDTQFGIPFKNEATGSHVHAGDWPSPLLPANLMWVHAYLGTWISTYEELF